MTISALIMGSANDIETQRKRVLWRANHRGIKEMDILVGGFATRAVAGMTALELSAFEVLLEIPDQDLLAYATRTAEVPKQRDTPLLRAMLEYRPS